MSQRSRVLKFVIIGDGGVGKTTLTKVFCGNAYVDQIMTIGIDIHTKESVVNGQKTILQIWDISGQSQFKFLISDFIRSANGVVLAFDCSKKATFQSLDEWIELIRTYEPKAPIFLIATKCDEGYDPALGKETIMEFVQKKNLIGFEETSAKLEMHVELPWKRLIENFLGFTQDGVPVIFVGSEQKLQPATPPITDRETSSFKPISLPPRPEIPAPPAAPNKPVAFVITNPTNSPGPINPPRPITSPSSKASTTLILPRPVVSKPITSPSPVNQSSPLNSPPAGADSRSSNFISKCPHCNTLLRDSQIKLKMEGKQVFCRGCLKLI